MKKLTPTEVRNLKYGDKVFWIKNNKTFKLTFVAQNPESENGYIFTCGSHVKYLHISSAFDDAYSGGELAYGDFYQGEYDRKFVGEKIKEYYLSKIDKIEKRYLKEDTQTKQYKGIEECTFNIWVEGYAITGSKQGAQYLGKIVANDFKEACEEACKQKNMMDNYNKDSNTYWGCRFFDNEIDARRSFG